MRRFHVCLHDATPAYARETQIMLRDLTPLVGRSLSAAVVPDWHGRWPLASHPDYCRMVQEGAGELLLHGYFHQRQEGRGPVSILTEFSDEMNGLDPEGTWRTLDRGQRVFTEVFGHPARGFLPPAWQLGHVHMGNGTGIRLDHVLGYFSLESRAGRTVPLATFSWDAGRWGWLGHVGYGLGWLSHTVHRGVPVLAVHPRDLERGFWPTILSLTETLLKSGHEPSTLGDLLDAQVPA